MILFSLLVLPMGEIIPLIGLGRGKISETSVGQKGKYQNCDRNVDDLL
jgi:hypothetical protein